ncbi:MAG TPA: class II fructose-bisphosphate aldolase, partial [Candidatus Brachybacterium merdigallinarum]|nr:class II fructose-bisphosphate aldolase [Candidatus Brachybacterium merdigallinarum]
HAVAKNYPINVALHTDHCAKEVLPTWVEPLIEWDLENRVSKGLNPLFQSHMWDGSAVPVDENLEIAEKLLEKSVAAKKILEIEVGVVGGEEDGVVADDSDRTKLFSTVEDGLKIVDSLGLGEKGRYLTALTFGNVHGVYKPGNVKLTPSVLLDIQKAVGEKHGRDMPFDLVMHGGSGSSLEEIQTAVDNGVIKMNIDTDTQYAFTRPVVSHMFENYDGVLKIDGEVGNKKAYDPRSWGKKAEAGMAARIVEACENLRSAGTHA